MSDEIIEMSDDGTFEIPSTPYEVKSLSDFDLPPPPNNDTDNGPIDDDAETDALKSISDLPSGGFKIYEHRDSTFLSILIRFNREDERTSKCVVSSSTIEVISTGGTTYKVPLGTNVKPESGTASAYEALVVLKVEKM